MILGILIFSYIVFTFCIGFLTYVYYYEIPNYHSDRRFKVIISCILPFIKICVEPKELIKAYRYVTKQR